MRDAPMCLLRRLAPPRRPALEQLLVLWRVLQLKPRQALTSEITGRLQVLSEDAGVRATLGVLEDLQARVTCRYYARRLDALGAADFVPSKRDLLYLNIPTPGKQETRLHETQGGAFTLLEVSAADCNQVVII